MTVGRTVYLLTDSDGKIAVDDRQERHDLGRPQLEEYHS